MTTRVLMASFCLALTATGGRAQAQTTSAPLPLEQLTQRAGIIFTGKVLRVELPSDSGDAPASVQITFQVEAGIRGARSGELLVIREWRGLWTANATPRYRLGDRALWFFHPPDPGGVTSPVGGSAGRLPITGGNRIRLSSAQLRSLRLRSSGNIQDSSGASVSADASLAPVAVLIRALRLMAASQ